MEKRSSLFIITVSDGKSFHNFGKRLPVAFFVAP
jgi:hypothetical protein